MKHKIIKFIVTLMVLIVLAITFVGFCACDKDEDPNGGEEPISYDIPLYETLPSYYLDVIDGYDLDNWMSSGKRIDILQSADDLVKYNIQDGRFTQEYFQERVVLMIEFISSSSDDNIKFRDIAIKDNKFYPIFISSSPLKNEPSCADIIYTLYKIECSKDVLNYEYGATLAINRRDTNCGGGNHDSIRTVFK